LKARRFCSSTAIRPKVHRIAQNLLLNALKYTHSGGVILRFGQSEPLTWRMEVSDSGPGIGRSGAAPMAEMLVSATETAREVGAESSQTIQDPARSDNPSDALLATNYQNSFDSVPGEGIGLSIVRRLCELLGATLELDSSTKGSSFRVIFPAKY
jgi:signal transduction histidine kinase